MCVCPSLMNEWTNERMTFLDDGGEGGSYSSKPSLFAQRMMVVKVVVIRVVRACLLLLLLPPVFLLLLLLLQSDYSFGVCVVCCCVNHHGCAFCFFPLWFGPRRLVVCCDFFLPSLRPDIMTELHLLWLSGFDRLQRHHRVMTTTMTNSSLCFFDIKSSCYACLCQGMSTDRIIATL